LGQTFDEGEVVSTFHSWLASVTERINQTMHYQFDGEIYNLLVNSAITEQSSISIKT